MGNSEHQKDDGYEKIIDLSDVKQNAYTGMIEYKMGRYKKAEPYLESAALDGHSYAQYYLGQLYEFGQGGVDQSILKAKSCYLASVINGCEMAITALKRISEKEAQFKKQRDPKTIDEKQP